MKIKDLNYYKSQNKVFWVPDKNIGKEFKAFDVVPCIFVEQKDEKYHILQFQESIKLDPFKYTAWRKLIGQTYNIRVDVLLIGNDSLMKLDGSTVNFEELERSQVVVDQKYLAKFAYKV